MAIYFGAATGRLQQAAHHGNGRRLASSIWTEQAKYLAAQHVEGDPFNCFDVSK